MLYLRRISLPAGPSHLLYLESGREAATLLVLAILAWLCGNSAVSRLRAFLVAFGLWDVAYYAWLYALSGYPRITSNDVLFLFPVAWVAPVWSALAFAIVLAAAGFFGIYRKRKLLFAVGLILGFLSFIAQGAGIAHAYPVPLFLLAIALAISAVGFRSTGAYASPKAPPAQSESSQKQTSALSSQSLHVSEQ